MTFDINLNWLGFDVDLNTVDAWMKANANAGSNYCGLSANSNLIVHFTSDPGSTVDSAIAAYWAGLTNAAPEATNYSPLSARQSAAASAKAASLASATSKLEALGLSADEIAAMIS